MKNTILNINKKCFKNTTLNYSIGYYLKLGKFYEIYYNLENEEIILLENKEANLNEVVDLLSSSTIVEISWEEFLEPISDLLKIF